jgi:hypothetical protein
MKLFAFLMAFLILTLGIIPCADAEGGAYDGKAKTELSKTNHPQDDQQQDDCSPFCHCTCCAGSFINRYIPGFNITLHYKSKLSNCFSPSELKEISLPIWQPPQIV